MKWACPILTALRLLNDYPDYRFTLDQVCYVAILERYPEEADAFRQLRWQTSDCRRYGFRHDANISGGESMVRQMLYGKSYFRESLEWMYRWVGIRHFDITPKCHNFLSWPGLILIGFKEVFQIQKCLQNCYGGY